MSEIQWPGKRVRDAYMKFFKEKGHTNVDPTLVFTASGTSQYMPKFLGMADPPTELKRGCNSQKYIRAGESYSDLENVGSINYPHTSFEMLSNWSFGDYFKEEAIAWAWELLTEVYGLPADRIYVTYFGGDEKAGLEPDNEARDIWLKVLPPRRVSPFGCKDNFWEMGDTGPCGTCTKVHYDCIELWNLVFIQSHREDGALKPLPTKFVETTMGFETLTSLLQQRMIAYDTDLFFPIYYGIQQATGAPEYNGRASFESEAYRVVADHTKTLSFAIANGFEPGQESALRRVFQRAVRYGMQYLEAKQGVFSGLVKTVVRVMGDVFTELKEHEEKITEILREEEASFCNIMQLVLDFIDSEKSEVLRSKALIELTRYIEDQDVAHLLWYTKTSNLIVQEIGYAQTSRCQSTLNTWERADHVSMLLKLLQCVAQVPEARESLIKGQVHQYLYPFVKAMDTEGTTEFLRRETLKVLDILVKVGYTHNEYLIYGGIVECCLRSLSMGSSSTRLVAVSIIAKILDMDVGFIHITVSRQLLFEVIHGLSLAVSGLEIPPLPILKMAIKCFHRLSENKESVIGELRRSLPRSFRDRTFRAILVTDSAEAQMLEELQDRL